MAYSLLMRNTVCHESVVYAVNNPSPSAVYGVDCCVAGGEHRESIVVSGENIRGERNSMEKNCIIVYPSPPTLHISP